MKAAAAFRRLPPKVVIDASFALKWLTPEADSGKAIDVLDALVRHSCSLIAPVIIDFEVVSVLQRLHSRGTLNDDEASRSLSSYRGLAIDTVDHPSLIEHAWDIAVSCHMPTIYDSVYAALADIEGCPLYTYDGRLLRALEGRTTVAVNPLGLV